MEIKCLRIHHEEFDDKYEVFDRYGEFHKIYHHPICIKNPPTITYFGFCPIESYDVTLEFKTPIDSKQIKIRRH